jgi:hypothetical protein
MRMASQSVFFRETKKRPENFYIVHYSCQSLHDDNEGMSPRITSIVVQHLATRQTISFSVHVIAGELGVGRDEVAKHFDTIELRLLSDFYAFVKSRQDKFWVHWNMRNITYGFEHLEHRYRLLAKDIPPGHVSVERRINLSDMLSSKYGKDYAGHPRLTTLMDLNGGVHRDFLAGEAEVQAFKEGAFIKLHRSTLSKVGFFSTVITAVHSRRLVTSARGLLHFADRLMDSRSARLVLLASSVCGVILTLFKGYELFVK